jgi:hypothetical protein
MTNFSNAAWAALEAGMTIELRGFMGLSDLFKRRHWTNPRRLSFGKDMTGRELLAELKIPAESVQVIFVNGKAFARDAAVITGDSRVALLPAGAPIPIAAGLAKAA